MAVQLLDKTLVMKQKRSALVQTVETDDSGKSTTYNVYEESKADRFDEIIDLLKGGNIYGEKENITLGHVDIPIENKLLLIRLQPKG